MRTLHLRDAKATPSALIEAAERGEATEVGRRTDQSDRPSFASLLMALPHDLETERDERGLRKIDP